MENTSTKKKLDLRTITAAAAGNFIEWYDWGVYGVVATVLAGQFFPKDDYALGLISVYALFAVSYLARPVGTIVFGHIADTVGRKNALSVTIMITCLATALIGCLPTYEVSGLLGPILLLVLRLVQSLGTGGEYSTAISFVYEHARPGRKARTVGILTAMTFVGILVGSVLATTMSLVLSAEAYDTWGWRLLFWLALPFGLIGIYLRSRSSEGAEFEEVKQEQKESGAPTQLPLFAALQQHGGKILLFIGFLGSWSIMSATLTSYLATFLKDNEHLTSSGAYTANTIASAVVVILVLCLSPLADRIGLLKMSVIGAGSLLVFVLPGFWLASQGTVAAFLGAAVLGGIKGVLAIPSLLAISQIFPADVRVTAGGLSYNISQSVLGGTAPLVAVWLNTSFKVDTAFAFYLMVAAVVTIVIAVTVGRKWVADSASHSGDVGVRDLIGPNDEAGFNNNTGSDNSTGFNGDTRLSSGGQR